MAKKKEKPVTKEDLKKAIEESYALGYKHALEKKSPPISLGSISSDITIANLTKNIGNNSRKINNDLLRRQRQVVSKHMKAFHEDAEKALDEIVAAADHNHEHKE